MEKESPWSARRITPKRPTYREKLLYYWNGIFHNGRNKELYVKFKAELEALQHRVQFLYTEIAKATEGIQKLEIGDAGMDLEHIAVQTSDYSRDGRFVYRKTGEDARKLDEDVLAATMEPHFLARCLGILCVTYYELDNLLLTKERHKQVDPKHVWLDGEEGNGGRDGTGEWGFKVRAPLKYLFALCAEISSLLNVAGLWTQTERSHATHSERHQSCVLRECTFNPSI